MLFRQSVAHDVHRTVAENPHAHRKSTLRHLSPHLGFALSFLPTSRVLNYEMTERLLPSKRLG
jgi:hypothetical protein